MGAPLVFLDTETTGLDPYRHEIWEVAAVRRDPDGTETEFHALVQHDATQAEALPDQFRLDHAARYHPEVALSQYTMVQRLSQFIGETEDYSQRPHIVGAVPSFDVERLHLLFDAFEVSWPAHHHLIDVETLAIGYACRGRRALIASGAAAGLAGDEPPRHDPPWDSEAVSRAVGVDPEQFERHTAMGDVRWAMAIYDAVMGS